MRFLILLLLALASGIAPACAQRIPPPAPRYVCVPVQVWDNNTRYIRAGVWDQVDALMRDIIGVTRTAWPCEPAAAPEGEKPPAAPTIAPSTPPAIPPGPDATK